MNLPVKPDCAFNADQLNVSCYCHSLNRQFLQEQLFAIQHNNDLYRMIVEDHPHLFAESPVFINQQSLDEQLQIISAVEQVVALPAFQQRVLGYAPEIAQFEPKALGVFLGYDFHLQQNQSKLIEINTNAGGGLINAVLFHAQIACCEKANSQPPGKLNILKPDDHIPEQLFMDMFYHEWQTERGNEPLQCIAIVDERPENQFLYPEFILFKHLFEQHRITCVICDPSELDFHANAVWYGHLKIDLIYNRLTDFSLEDYKLELLRNAYLASEVVITPHPRSHAIYADKRNLQLLTNDEFLQEIGVSDDLRQILSRGIAKTILVAPQAAQSLWHNRKHLFFKPAKGYGGKAAYRGDKMTKQVFEYILQHDYVAQSFIKPSERHLEIADEDVTLKLDLRHYVYNSQTQSICARLYQGQTTNFRTPGGGFAQVAVI
jgi:hypothetical protein